MRISLLCSAALLTLLAAVTPAYGNEPGALPDIPMAKQPQDDRLIGGQPSEQHLRAARDAGVATVVNLRGAGEDPGYDEAGLVRDLGMTYIAIPISGAADLTDRNVARFDHALSLAGDEPILLHCASGNRVGALFALHAARHEGLDVEQALDLGRRHGLTSLEPAVRERLENDGG